MSVKIYEAYQYNGNIFTLIDRLKDLRIAYIDYCVCTINKYMNSKLRVFDIYVYSILKKEKESPLKGFLNLDAELVLIPYKKKIIIIPFNVRLDGKSFFTEENGFTDYGYWNNTDKPDELTDRQWNSRRKFYNELFDKNEPLLTYANMGFNYDLFNDEIIQIIARKVCENNNRNNLTSEEHKAVWLEAKKDYEEYTDYKDTIKNK